MEISTRAQAKANGAKTYFTGMPCRNDHLTYRYVQSGACAGCVAAANGRDVAEAPAGSVLMKDEQVEVKLGVYEDQLLTLRDAIASVSAARWPDATPTQLRWVRPTVQIYGGVRMYMMRVHPLDINLARAIANEFIRVRSTVNTEAIRELAGERAKQYDTWVDTTPPLTFNPN